MITTKDAVKVLSLTLTIVCYGIYFYSDRKKDCYQAIKFLVLGAIMQNLTLHLKQRGVKNMIIGFLSGLFIGAVAGVAVMSLCAAAKERDEL